MSGFLTGTGGFCGATGGLKPSDGTGCCEEETVIECDCEWPSSISANVSGMERCFTFSGWIPSGNYELEFGHCIEDGNYWYVSYGYVIDASNYLSVGYKWRKSTGNVYATARVQSNAQWIFYDTNTSLLKTVSDKCNMLGDYSANNYWTSCYESFTAINGEIVATV